MRHLMGGLNILIRKDLGLGALASWNMDEKRRWVLLDVSQCVSWKNRTDRGHRAKCFCTSQFTDIGCSHATVQRTASIPREAFATPACDTTTVNRKNLPVPPKSRGSPPLRSLSNNLKVSSHPSWQANARAMAKSYCTAIQPPLVTVPRKPQLTDLLLPRKA